MKNACVGVFLVTNRIRKHARVLKLSLECTDADADVNTPNFVSRKFNVAKDANTESKHRVRNVGDSSRFSCLVISGQYFITN